MKACPPPASGCHGSQSNSLSHQCHVLDRAPPNTSRNAKIYCPPHQRCAKPTISTTTVVSKKRHPVHDAAVIVNTGIMSLRNAQIPQQGAVQRPIDDDESDEELLANDYREQVEYRDGEKYDEFDSVGGGLADLQAQLQQAATPLEYGATLETKMQSYDSYCNLFHFILNSDGPVDIEVPSVSSIAPRRKKNNLTDWTVLLGLGCHR